MLDVFQKGRSNALSHACVGLLSSHMWRIALSISSTKNISVDGVFGQSRSQVTGNSVLVHGSSGMHAVAMVTPGYLEALETVADEGVVAGVTTGGGVATRRHDARVEVLTPRSVEPCSGEREMHDGCQEEPRGYTQNPVGEKDSAHPCDTRCHAGWSGGSRTARLTTLFLALFWLQAMLDYASYNTPR